MSEHQIPLDKITAKVCFGIISADRNFSQLYCVTLDTHELSGQTNNTYLLDPRRVGGRQHKTTKRYKSRGEDKKPGVSAKSNREVTPLALALTSMPTHLALACHSILS